MALPETERPDPSAIAAFVTARPGGFEAWHDGLGYPLEAIATMNRATREALACALPVRDGRDIEALVALALPGVPALLRQRFEAAAGRQRSTLGLALLYYAPDVVAQEERTQLVCHSIASLAQGQDQGLDAVLVTAQRWHPDPVLDALWCALECPDPVVVMHVAALLTYLYGLAAEPFDMALRSQYLRFISDDAAERQEARLGLRLRVSAPGVAVRLNWECQ